MASIPVDLCQQIKFLKFKPSSFNEFCKEIKRLYNIDNPDKLTYEYSTNDQDFHSLNIYNYSNFYKEDKVEKLFAYSSPDEANTYEKQKRNENLSNEEIIINEDSSNEKENHIFSDNINNNEKINNNFNNDDIIKQQIINAQLEKIRQSKNLSIDQEKEIILQEYKEDDNNEEELKEKNNGISDQLNDIINKNFNKLKKDLINESKVQLSQIVMESTLKNNEIEDDIKNLSSVENHYGISCSGCGECPIIGIRYKCVYCSDFDYCEKCEEEKGYVHMHPFYKLRFKI